jgi:hypothetical protein
MLKLSIDKFGVKCSRGNFVEPNLANLGGINILTKDKQMVPYEFIIEGIYFSFI